MTACPSQTKIDAAIWTNNFAIPKHICVANPELSLFGFSRKVTIDGQQKEELISICKKEAGQFLEMTKEDYQKLIDEAFPKPTPSP